MINQKTDNQTVVVKQTLSEILVNQRFDFTFDKQGYAVIKVSFEKAEAKIIFFWLEK